MAHSEGGREQQSGNREPVGFGEHTRRSSGERAHEKGWGLNEEQRRELPEQKQNYEGGTDYDYGARDFGDAPVDTSQAKLQSATLREVQVKGDTSGGRSEERKEGTGKTEDQRTSAKRG